MKINKQIIFRFLFVIIAFFIFAGDLLAFSASRGGGFSSRNNNIYGDYFLFSKPQTVSLDLEDVHLFAVLKMLSQQTGLNFISTEAVRERRITAYLSRVPLKEAVDILFEANNLTYNYYPEANMFVVKEIGKVRPERKARVYNLQHARLGSSRMASEIADLLGSSESTCIKEAIENLLDGEGTIVENARTNTLFVSAPSTLFPVIDQLVDALDKPSLKVMIEAEILDVSKGVIDKMGFEHRGVGASLTPFPDSFVLDSIPSFMGTATASSSYGIEAAFQKEDSTARTLARPRILTLNNETAEIEIISDEIVGTVANYDQDGRLTSLTAERADTGVSLRVTPQVNSVTGEITLVVHPSVRDATASEFRDREGNEFFNVNDKATRSVVRLGDGETLLLGGLITASKSEGRTGMPWLEDVPILGGLFRSKNTTSSDRELVIFLTPRIVKSREYSVKKTESGRLLRREQMGTSRGQQVEAVLDQLSTK